MTTFMGFQNGASLENEADERLNATNTFSQAY